MEAGDGRARLFFANDCCQDRDEKLVEKGFPTCTEEEMDAYLMAPVVEGKAVKEAPLDKDNAP